MAKFDDIETTRKRELESIAHSALKGVSVKAFDCAVVEETREMVRRHRSQGVHLLPQEFHFSGLRMMDEGVIMVHEYVRHGGLGRDHDGAYTGEAQARKVIGELTHAEAIAHAQQAAELAYLRHVLAEDARQKPAHSHH